MILRCFAVFIRVYGERGTNSFLIISFLFLLLFLIVPLIFYQVTRLLFLHLWHSDHLDFYKCWVPPASGLLRLNTDTTFKEEDSAGFGSVIRNSNKYVDAFSYGYFDLTGLFLLFKLRLWL
ncbi:hypothetical protein TorRG33x02_198720 [Trema orientale]|uniref:Transmembrane protein n=1 Tax=Trema orientale TaxID=63057 RepID=A0A2P5EFI3_TREOI|nr:hypothetical protein TorRG33x02_198720 [Trema orientale]